MSTLLPLPRTRQNRKIPVWSPPSRRRIGAPRSTSSPPSIKQAHRSIRRGNSRARAAWSLGRWRDVERYASAAVPPGARRAIGAAGGAPSPSDWAPRPRSSRRCRRRAQVLRGGETRRPGHASVQGARVGSSKTRKLMKEADLRLTAGNRARRSSADEAYASLPGWARRQIRRCSRRRTRVDAVRTRRCARSSSRSRRAIARCARSGVVPMKVPMKVPIEVPMKVPTGAPHAPRRIRRRARGFSPRAPRRTRGIRARRAPRRPSSRAGDHRARRAARVVRGWAIGGGDDGGVSPGRAR